MRRLYATLLHWFSTQNLPPRRTRAKQSQQTESLEVRTLLAAHPLADAPDIQFEVDNDWGSGRTAILTLNNDESTAFTDWQLEFQYSGEIQSLWNAEVQNLGGGRYRITPPSWDDTLDPGESLAIGFVAVGTHSEPSDFVFMGNGDPTDPGDPDPVLNVPNQPSVSVLADAGSGGFRVTMNLWAGDAAAHWKLYENGTLIYEADLSGSSTPQTDSLLLTDRDYGVFSYQVEVSNAAGTAVSDEVVYVAGDASDIGIAGVDLAEQALQVTIDQATYDYTLTSPNEAAQFSVVTNNSRVIQAEMVDGNTLRITGLEAGRASLRIMDLDSGEERFIGVRVRNADGQLPGLPDYVTLGSVSEDTTGDLSFWQDFGDSDATNKYVDSRYIYLNGGPITGWRSWDPDRVSSYVRESLKLGMVPQFVYYNIPDGGESYTTDVGHIQSLSYMESYFQDLKFALDTIRTEAGDELVQMIMEPDFIGYLMQNAGAAASDISAMTSAAYSSGVLQEGVDPQFDNTVTGLIEAINYSISKYAPNVEFGWQFNLWASPGIENPIPATGIVHLTDTLGVEAGRAAIAREAELIAQYYMDAGILSYGAGFISLDKYGLDAGAQNGAADDPAGSTWFWNSDHWNNYLLIVQTLTQTTDREMVLWQLPVGHINDSLAENPYDENGVFDPLTNTTRQYEDSAPTFFLGDTFTASGDRLDYFSTNALNDSKLTVSGNTITWGSHMEEARAAGIRQILFGAGVGISTDSIGTEPTDDYWWITKVQEYYQDPVALDGTVVEPPEEVIPVVSISGATIAEGDSNSVLATLTISLSEAATQPVTVNYQTSNGTATAGEDYEASSGQVSFAVGETSKTISVRIYGDTQVEADEQFYVTLSSPIGAVLDAGTATATNTITNDDVVTNENETAVATPFETAVTISIGTSSGDPDFGSHIQQYVDGTLLPSQYSQEQLDQIVGNYYDQWKSDWLRVDPGGNGYRVVMDSQGRSTSESQGYGMLVLAHMDGYDPDAQTIFDGLFRYSRANPSEGNPDLMDWAQPDAYGNSSAFDGDADIAYALLVADAQWGSAGEINYLQEAITIINAMYASTIGPQSHLPMLGDWVDPNGSQHNQWSVRTSDFMYDHFRAFEAATQTGAWDEVLAATQDVMTKLQQQSGTGLVPDFVIFDPVTGDVSPAPSGFLEVNDQYYWYNAGRVPWRLGTDAALSGDDVSLAQAQMLSEFFQQSSGGDPAQILGGYQLDGTPLNNWSDPFFRAAVGVSAMTGSDAADQAWLNSVFDSVATTHSNYYADSVSMLSMLVMSGNYVNPSASAGESMTLQSFIQPAHGQVVDNQDGTLTYTPATGFSGSDSFVYTTVSESGSVTTTTVSVTVEEYVAVVPEMVISDVTVTEGDSGTTQAVFTVTLDQPATETVTVQFRTQDGTAVAGMDYQAASGQLVFQPGETEKTITVLISGDVLIESGEDFQVVLEQVVGATLSSANATGNILDNDAPAPTAEVDFTNVNDWGSGFQGAIEIRNESESTLEGWTLEFTFAGEITDIWNAEIVSHVGDTYIIRGASWNHDILAGGAISFGFIASPGGLVEPLSDFLLNGTPV
ncbi:glycosyl hydrolase family 8 [Gimesia panareensis]|uniref:glycosyl hydrolase family 8 n=1 Tax=Gimesia panareensis TaxID=2527978 RepID=UPI00118BF9D9|nr:glycosyl hydrolase family 8 [Gimesia panareensis]QDU49298.1 Endoglucanase precursor [Gimesia panareensis]